MEEKGIEKYLLELEKEQDEFDVFEESNVM